MVRCRRYARVYRAHTRHLRGRGRVEAGAELCDIGGVGQVVPEAVATHQQPAAAGGLSRDEAALVAGIGGLIIGATIAAPSYHHHHPRYDVVYDGSSTWERHVERCYARYRSYDHRTDTFVGYDGGEHYCQL